MPLVQCLHGTTLLCTPVLKSAPAYKPVNSLAESVRADDFLCFNACVQSSIRAYTRAFVRTLGVNAAAGRYNPSNASPYYNEHHKVRYTRNVLNSHTSFSTDSRLFSIISFGVCSTGQGREQTRQGTPGTLY